MSGLPSSRPVVALPSSKYTQSPPGALPPAPARSTLSTLKERSLGFLRPLARFSRRFVSQSNSVPEPQLPALDEAPKSEDAVSVLAPSSDEDESRSDSSTADDDIKTPPVEGRSSVHSAASPNSVTPLDHKYDASLLSGYTSTARLPGTVDCDRPVSYSLRLAAEAMEEDVARRALAAVEPIRPSSASTDAFFREPCPTGVFVTMRPRKRTIHDVQQPVANVRFRKAPRLGPDGQRLQVRIKLPDVAEVQLGGLAGLREDSRKRSAPDEWDVPKRQPPRKRGPRFALTVSTNPPARKPLFLEPAFWENVHARFQAAEYARLLAAAKADAALRRAAAASTFPPARSLRLNSSLASPASSRSASPTPCPLPRTTRKLPARGTRRIAPPLLLPSAAVRNLACPARRPRAVSMGSSSRLPAGVHAIRRAVSTGVLVAGDCVAAPAQRSSNVVRWARSSMLVAHSMAAGSTPAAAVPPAQSQDFRGTLSTRGRKASAGSLSSVH